MRTVRSARVARGEPRALTHEEFARLLRMPDRRTHQGKRDLASSISSAPPACAAAEAANLPVADVAERRRAADSRLRQAIVGSTSWWVTVCAQRPRQSTCCSRCRTGQPPRVLATRDVARIVARHAEAAALPQDRRTPHVLRHTFCTHLADTGADVGNIRELAGDADIRTTTIYPAVNDDRLESAITERTRQRHSVREAPTND